ncbi:hypothetical protein G4Y73_09335 [Wenzhouxiangella sp. XN201]|uniref:hypothetical protein n=1 Tax=Wenzhouxiangella sp. XN201 TaxID=2710755 RepID=UPI0013CA00DD|nr:hypothetical protein [Wenzhouxiangella sp. XN201]NEZ04346.1 hypothetical protein [Wenzhouxiangella sp. XN201]
MKSPLALTLAFSLAIVLPLAHAGDEPDMIGTMGDMQRFMHKLGLSVAAKNPELVDFYAHELEESIEAAESIDQYHDIRVGELTKAMLAPAFEAFEQAVEAREHERVGERYDGLIEACNACHQATGYDFIQIRSNDSNPYMQSFEPDED